MKTLTNCRSCTSPKLREILDLGEHYTSDFRQDSSKPNKYPLVAVACEDCALVQLKHTTPQAEMYHENYGFKSGVSDSIKNDLKDNVEHALKYEPKPSRWLDIASNDGTLLSFVPKHVYRVGVDPLGFLCDEAEQHADKIHRQYFDANILGTDKPFDVVTSISCFYDMDDPNKFVSDVEKVLAPWGVWDIQQNYLLPTMELGALDNFCHEHLTYFTLLSLEPILRRRGLEVIDVVTSTVNGGSIRTIVARVGAHSIQESVERQRQIERQAGLGNIETYTTFGKNADAKVKQLRKVVTQLKAEGKSLAILAASTRGATIWQSAGIGPDQVDYAVERNPAKVGKWFSAIGVPIISEEEARKRKPDVMLVGPWFFADEVIDRERAYLDQGGKMLLPLPEVKIVP